MRRIVAALLLFCAGVAHAGDRLTVDQAVAAALAHNANVASARLEVKEAQTRVDGARTKRLPSLKVDAMGGEALSNLSIEVRDGAGETTRVDLARTFNRYAPPPHAADHGAPRDQPRREAEGDVAGRRP